MDKQLRIKEEMKNHDRECKQCKHADTYDDACKVGKRLFDLFEETLYV